MKAWIGIDPGARYTGVVGVLDGEPITWCVLDRETDPESYLDRVERAVGVQSERLIELGPVPHIAIENVSIPTGFRDGKKQFANPRDLIPLAFAVGYLARAFPNHVLIDPHGHGHRSWLAYPQALMTAREQVNARAKPTAIAGQHSLMRHARSAYDVALAAPLVARTEAARRPA